VKRVQDMAWPAQMLIGASTLAAAALIVGLVALVLGAVTQSFFMVDESQSGSDANFGVPIEVDEPAPIVSEDG
jgi:rRNA processing protein Gar1